MKKKLAALAMIAVMVLSLAGCGKKIEGTYVAEVDITDALIERLTDYFEEKDYDDYDISDYDWKGSVSITYELELEDGEYTFKPDAKKLEKDAKKFMTENMEGILTLVLEEYLENYYYDEDTDVEEYLETYGYSSVWELFGYAPAEEFDDDHFEDGIIADKIVKESGDYTVDGDTIILEDCGSSDKKLTYEDGGLKTRIDLTEAGFDVKTKVTFEREDN